MSERVQHMQRRPRRARRMVPPERNTAYPDTRFGLARYTRQVQTGSLLLGLLGSWLIVAPWLVGFAAAPAVTADSCAVGVVLVAIALVRIAAPLHLAGSAWLAFALGFWVVGAGFVLSYPRGFDRAGAYWTMVATGALVIAVAGWNTAAADRVALRARVGQPAPGGRMPGT